MLFFLLALTLSAPPVRAQEAVDPILIQVNGSPIRRSEVLTKLWKVHGREALREMVDELILRQAADAKGLKVDGAELEKRLGRVTSRYPNKEAFLSDLAENGATVESLKADISHDIVRENFLIQAAGAKVSEAELKEAYAKRKKELTMPEGVHLLHMVLKTPEEAKDVTAKIKAGGGFRDLARERSLAASGKAAGGDYGFVFRGMLPKELETAAFAMKENEIRTISTDKAQHVLQVVARRAPQQLDFEQARDTLREYVLSNKVGKALPRIMSDLRAKADIKAPGEDDKK